MYCQCVKMAQRALPCDKKGKRVGIRYKITIDGRKPPTLQNLWLNIVKKTWALE